MIWLKVVPGGRGYLYPKAGSESKDVILEFDPSRPRTLEEEIYHILLGHHREFGKGGFSYKRRWELEREVVELKLRIGKVNKNRAIMCLYNIRQDLICEADEGRQIDGEDRWCLSWPCFLSQTKEVTGLSQHHVENYIVQKINK